MPSKADEVSEATDSTIVNDTQGDSEKKSTRSRLQQNNATKNGMTKVGDHFSANNMPFNCPH